MSQPTKAIFTSVTLSRQQVTSEIFTNKGVSNEAPCAISETRITAITSSFPAKLMYQLNALWAYVLCYLTKDFFINLPSPLNAPGVSKSEFDLFPRPPLVVSFLKRGGKSEDREAKLAELGFSKQSLQRYTFYKGPGSSAAVHQLVEMGAVIDCFTPSGSTNIAGFVTLDIINRIFHAALGFLAEWAIDL